MERKRPEREAGKQRSVSREKKYLVGDEQQNERRRWRGRDEVCECRQSEQP